MDNCEMTVNTMMSDYMLIFDYNLTIFDYQLYALLLPSDFQLHPLSLLWLVIFHDIYNIACTVTLQC